MDGSSNKKRRKNFHMIITTRENRDKNTENSNSFLKKNEKFQAVLAERNIRN
jgi:hypothetical protein